MAGRKLNAPTWTPSGSNGLSSSSGRRLGTVVAMVAGTASGLVGGAPGRFCRRKRAARGAPGGCSCLGVGAAAPLAVGVVSALAVGLPGGCDAGSLALPGCAPGLDRPWLGLALRLRALVESKPDVPAPNAG